MKKILIIISLLLAVAASGCSIHKLEVQQGNIITPEMLDELEIGMDKNRVRFILGTPPMIDPFHSNRWDYPYTFRQKAEKPQISNLVLWFDEQDKLLKIDSTRYQEPTLPSDEVE